jgi:hypothetical protein
MPPRIPPFSTPGEGWEGRGSRERSARRGLTAAYSDRDTYGY